MGMSLAECNRAAELGRQGSMPKHDHICPSSDQLVTCVFNWQDTAEGINGFRVVIIDTVKT